MSEVQGKHRMDRHADHGSATNKKQKGEHDTQKTSHKADGHQAADKYEELKMKLQEMPVEHLKEMLRENSQDDTGSQEALVERCADQMIYGPLDRCPTCGGGLGYANNEYKCLGFISEWSKCNFRTHEPHRKTSAWKVPSKIKRDTFSEYLKDTKNRPVRELTKADKPFSGMTIALSGRMSRPQQVWREQIEKYGGKFASAVKQGVTCLVAPEQEASRGASSKFEEATELQIPIVKESWLTTSIEKGQAEPMDVYAVMSESAVLDQAGLAPKVPWERMHPAEEAAESLMAELKLYGKRGVYKDCDLVGSGGYIYERDGIIYNCAFSICDQAAGLNHYAIMELVELPGGPCFLFFKKGKVGNPVGVKMRLDEMHNPDEAIKEFVRLFEELTGNEFEPWEREKKFTKKHSKFYPIDMADGFEVRYGALGVRQLGIAASHSKLDPRVSEICKALFSQETYRYALTEMGIDSPDLPVGNVTDVHVKRCEEVLLEFAEFLKKGKEHSSKREAMCLDFSNRWFSLLHTTRPMIMDDIQQLAELAAPALESVRDISVASQLIGDMTGSTLDDPLDDRYAKLGTTMMPLDKDGEDYKMIFKYLEKTFEPVQYRDGAFGAMMEDVCMLESTTGPSLEDMKKLPNKVLIWCGTRTSNLVRCLKKGMLPAIFEAPAPGYMFGKGIYCTDAAAKAAQYGFTGVDRPEGFLLLAVVSLGEKVVELTKPEKNASEYEKQKLGIRGLGRKTPKESEYFTWRGDVKVPCGSLVPSGHDDSSLEFNEYCVYDPKQVKPMFLVRIRYSVVA